MRVSHRLAMHVPVERCRLNNATPMVSFTFDDIPKSAATTGAAILEDHGARGTFYVSGGLVGTTESPDWAAVDAEDVVALHRSGHEIGCHTYSHRRTCDLDRVSLAGEIEQNRRYFQSLEPSIELSNFAYPFGYGSFAHKRRLKTAFQSCRSIVPGVNSGTVDPQFLRAVPLIDRHIDGDGIERAFDQAQITNGWLIFYSHDVVEQPSRYGCSPALMNHALKAASRRQIPVLTMAEALLCAAA
ncbi:polysaccharide deacetylase family protein [Bradyrhizobium erythrophlei]|jgi:peptidoglycan/xylan/chitin deacetylase (PgdA/CDA1 family)|uniref:Chitooligosaccharide deacetylase n=1 Tax=Bradyrhizobium erythrophlei TaxID=1437360 RepID=A0A1M5X2E3_9BRAD|nr:polysaccharide deacetylase family protein [Bradyrhizobium erythrophlei]SHH93383.1 Polysaccharide deacetylase [Bradyrhizobium erythrophlei]